MNKMICSGLMFMVVMAVQASATLVVDFNDLSLGKLEGQSGGTGLSGSWVGNTNNMVVSGNLAGPAGSASLIHPQSGTAQSVAVSSSSAYADSQTRIALATPYSGVTWVSFVVDLGSNYRVGLGFNSTGVHTDSDVDGNFFFNAGVSALQVRNNPDNPGATVTGSTSLADLGTNFFVVARLDTAASNTNINVWLNPTSLEAFDNAPDIADASINFTDDQVSGISVLGFNSASRIDNVRFGTELGHVVVPEPGTLVLLVGGALFFALTRRRLLRRGTALH